MLTMPINYKDEYWAPVTKVMVPNIKPIYLISNFGNVLNTNNGMILNQNLKGHGYYYVKLQLEDGSWKDQVIHRLVAMAFCCIQHPLEYYLENDYQVNHINGIKTYNHYSNLEWVTNLENMRHAIANHLINNRSETHYKAILSNEQVHAICKLLEEGKYTYKQIDQILGLNLHDPTRYISEIKLGIKWKDISSQYNIDRTPKK